MIQIQLLNALDTFLEAVSVVAKWQELDPQVAATEKKIGAIFKRQGQIFLRGFAGLKGQIGEAAFREALSADDWVRVFDTATGATLEAFFEVIQGAASDGLRRGATQTLADVNIDFAFNLRNPRAEQYLQEHGYGLISQIDAVTRGNIATIIDNGTAEGWSYNRMAREISSLYSQMAVGQPQQHIDSRAHLIAVTEIGNAYEAGGAIVIQDLQDAGLQMEKMWLTVGDDRVSDGCEGNAAEGWIPYTQAHASGHMNPLRFPGCRCTELYRRKPSTRPTTVAAPAVDLTSLIPTPDATAIAKVQDEAHTVLRQLVDDRGDTEEEWIERAVGNFRSEVENNKVEIAIQGQSLDQVLTNGRYLNFFEVLDLFPESEVSQRVASYLDMHEFAGIPRNAPASARPIYGYVNTGRSAQNAASVYGETRLILRDNVKARLTYTPNDSMTPLLEQRMLPATLDALTETLFGSEIGKWVDTRNKMVLYNRVLYVETQIYGGIELADIEVIVFDPDDLQLLTRERFAQLRQSNIEIRVKDDDQAYQTFDDLADEYGEYVD